VLIGQDPRNIEHLWQTMYRGPFYRGGPILVSAISGIEQALWDIKGKYHNMPVYEMVGGACRSKIPMYGRARGEDVKTLVASALDRKNEGLPQSSTRSTRRICRL
jgi:galactonate dehydratase